MADLAPGPARDLVALVKRRMAQGLPADYAASTGLPEVEELGGLVLIADLLDEGALPSALPRYLTKARWEAVRAELQAHLDGGPIDPEQVRQIVNRLEPVTTRPRR